MKLTIAIVLLLSAVFAHAQDKPVDVPKSELPPLAKCLLCTDEGPEKPAGGVTYKGATYYFCNAAEIKAFKKDPDAHIPPVLPRPAPSIDLVDSTGKRWNEAAMKDKVLLVDFWATWCQPCIATLPALEKVHEKFKNKGFEILSISIDEKKGAYDRFLEKHPFPNPVMLDSTKVWSKWSVTAIPATFLVKNGQIIGQWRGKQTEATLSKAIEEALLKN